MRCHRSTLAAAAAALLAAAAATAQTYPDRPLRLIAPWPPGGSVDTTARYINEQLGKELGQPIVIDNRSGATGNIGSEAVARARPDGYTLLINTIAIATGPALFPNLPFDPLKDFAPISLVAEAPHLLVVSNKVPAKSVRELVDLMRANPGKLSYASAGNGTNFHMAAELFKDLSKTYALHVPYRGGGPALLDTISGQVDFSFPSLTAGLPQATAGRVRALAVTSKTRSPASPDLPTIAEAGLPGYEFTSWQLILAPAGTPPEITGRIHRAIVETMKSPQVLERYAREGTVPRSTSPEEASAFLKAEVARWSKIIRERGIKGD
jgi:tripartite-type tricarboxylate transporter receptor subunit TctC